MTKSCWALFGIAFALGGCTFPTYLVHPTTGQVVVCGPYFRGLYDQGGGDEDQQDCIDAYKRQGYVESQ